MRRGDVTLSGVDIPFLDMVGLAMKWMLACVVAALGLSILTICAWGLLLALGFTFLQRLVP